MSVVSPMLGPAHGRWSRDSAVRTPGGLDRGRSRAPQNGAGAVEFLVAVPAMLLLGLLIWQWALVMQSRAIIDFAVREGARSGALGHAAPEAIERGIVSGLTPLWVSNTDLTGPASALPASAARFGVAVREGWLAWRQLSPTRESFADWGTPAAAGVRSVAADAALEIPLDNPALRSRHGVPLPVAGRTGGDMEFAPMASALVSAGTAASGSIGASGSGLPTAEPVGPASGQTFREAGVLRLELSVGVPLHVPLAGRFISWAARILSGCEAGERPYLGALRFDGPGHAESAPAGPDGAAPKRGLRGDQTPACAQFSGLDHSGRVLPRLPVKVVGEARMQSAARLSARTPSGAGAKRFGGAGLSMSVASENGWQNPPQGAPGGADDLPAGLAAVPPGIAAATDSSAPQSIRADRPPGFLQIGGEREIWVPGACGLSPS